MTEETGAPFEATRIGHVGAIDGLRAVAVLAVVAYHANPAWLPGGLTGVDIFFAISGFVVPASILWRRFDSAGAALAFFYTRRIFRIFPALIAMLVIASLLVVLFVPRSWLGDGILATALTAVFGASNFVLYSLDGDYFSPRATYNPFLHTWSLAVEEQFYLLFSCVLGLLCAHRQSAKAATLTGLGLGLLTAGSFLMAVRFSATAPAYAFYLLPPRFWELGTGALVYLALPTLIPRLQQTRSGAHLALMIGAALGLLAPLAIGTKLGHPYPVPAVVPSVLATAFLMASATARPKSFLTKALSAPPLRYVGLVSYSLYLWHWPVFVLMRWTIGFASGFQIATGIVASFALAIVSYHLVETPLRSLAASPGLSRGAALGGALGVSLAACALLFGLSRTADRLSLSVTADAATWFPYKIDAKLAAACKVDNTEAGFASGRLYQFKPQCRTDLSAHRLFVAGDSHSLAYKRMLEGFAATTGIPVTLMARPGCAILLGRDVPTGDCRDFADAVMQRLDQEAKATDLVFFAALRMPKDGSEAADGLTPTLSERESTRIVNDAIEKLEPLANRNVPVIIEAPQPVFPGTAYRCADWFNHDNPACRVAQFIDRSRFEVVRQPLLSAMEKIVSTHSGVSIWDPSDLFCDTTVCKAWLGKKPMFFDEDHFSGFANDQMLPRFRAFVLKRLQHP